MIDDKEREIENLRLQKCSLKNRSCWKLVNSLEPYMKQRQQTSELGSIAYREISIIIVSRIPTF